MKLIYKIILLLSFMMMSIHAEVLSDICYEPIQESGISFGPADIMYTTKIPIRNLNSSDQLTDVTVAVGSSSLFSLMSECGIDDVEGNCTQESGGSIFIASAFNDGVVYDLDTLDADELKTPYEKSTFSLLSNDDYDIVGSYVKDGTTYTGVINPCSTDTMGERDFILRYQKNLYGDVKVIGNTILCELNDNGECVEPTGEDSNAERDLEKAPNSSATLQLPEGAKVIYARLYWQGREKATTTNDAWTDDLKTKAKTIKIKKDGDTNYTTYSADFADFAYNQSTNYIRIYHASADVTDFITGDATYSIDTASFETYTGESWTDTPSDGLGAYGAWVLSVVYEDLNGMYRNVSLFDGYKIISTDSNDVDVQVSGFLTPRAGTVDSQAYTFVGEGDKYISGDHIYMSGKDHPTNPMVDLGTFDSTIDVNATRDPNLQNNNGIDIRAYNVGTDGEDIIKNEETGADFKFTTTQDTYFPSLIVFSTELYVPKFCYDYAYSQQDVYFTEKNDGTKLPRIQGLVSSGNPIKVKVFIRNLVESDINVTDMMVNVVDINTSQAKYTRETTQLANNGDIIPTDIPDSDLSVSDEYIKNIPIGTISSNDFFYVYYKIDPSINDLNISLDVEATYNLTFNDTTIPYSLILGKDMPMCTTSNFKYAPASGIFNIVHEDYYKLDEDSDSDYHYYNLPTQVSSREGNFKLLVLDPNDAQHNTLLSDHDIFYTEVEMIDASAFHDTNASCYEPTSAISTTVGIFVDANITSVPFDKNALIQAINDGRTSLSSSSEFYQAARQNTAFRVRNYENVFDSYNQPAYKKNDDGTFDTAWEMNWNGENCVGDVNENGESNNNDKVSNYCQDGHSLNSSDLEKCTKCVSVIHFICSRDNFAIRPEAFMMQLDDQNQTDATQHSDITTLADSGSSTATLPSLNLAAGYDYKLDVNATNHIGNNASPGYTRTVNVDNLMHATYQWNPNGHVVSGCNAPVDVNLTTFRFLDGKVDVNTSLNNIGAYKLTIIDKSWTAVDSTAAFMTHHTGNYFTTTLDCATDSSNVLYINQTMNPDDITTLNGCDISSNHRNNEANIQYNDFDITFHPYKFDLFTIQPSFGLNRITDINSSSYVYYADISKDENMSYHLDGKIKALGENNSTLSNFVDNCYAVPVDINITTSNRDLNDSKNNHVDYKVRFHDLNSTGSVIAALDINVTDNTITSHTNDILLQTQQTSTKGYFPKDLDGSMSTRLNMNYKKEKNITINPTTVAFIKYQVNCTDDTNDCTFNADLKNDKTTQGSKDLNATLPIKFYYGRANAGKQRYEVPTDSPYNANIYYEIFCYGATCNTALLPSTEHVDDIRWYQNTKHTISNDGTIHNIITPAGVSANNLTTSTNPATVKLPYDGSVGYPYTTTIEVNASNWLIYNKSNANATTNSFEAEYNKANSGWSGERETETNTKAPNTAKTNRRTMW